MKTFTFLFLILTTLTCPGGDKLCAMCDDKKCVECFASYLENGKCRQSSVMIEKCLAYSADQKCQICYHGYKLVNNKCLEITIKDCLEEVNGKCVMCKRDILVTDGVCGKVKCEKKDCAFCTRNNQEIEVCNLCDSGNVKNSNGECVDESDNNEHCMVLNKDGTCMLCDYNYYYSFGKCTKSDVMNIKMSSDQGFVDKVKDRITNLFGGEIFISLSYVVGLVTLMV